MIYLFKYKSDSTYRKAYRCLDNNLFILFYFFLEIPNKSNMNYQISQPRSSNFTATNSYINDIKEFCTNAQELYFPNEKIVN